MTVTAGRPRAAQGDRRSRSRAALLEAAARGLSKYGYANLVLKTVAAEAGYTRGALYHLFENKADLALAVVAWVHETWSAEVGYVMDEEVDAATALLALARAHAVYCRRDVARVMLTLRVEFEGQDHPVSHAVAELLEDLEARCVGLIDTGRSTGVIPPGPPSTEVADAYLATVEAVGIAVGGRAPFDVQLAERAVRGLLGLPPVETVGTDGGS